jgi:hypothetical protein
LLRLPRDSFLCGKSGDPADSASVPDGPVRDAAGTTGSPARNFRTPATRIMVRTDRFGASPKRLGPRPEISGRRQLGSWPGRIGSARRRNNSVLGQKFQDVANSDPCPDGSVRYAAGTTRSPARNFTTPPTRILAWTDRFGTPPEQLAPRPEISGRRQLGSWPGRIGSARRRNNSVPGQKFEDADDRRLSGSAGGSSQSRPLTRINVLGGPASPSRQRISATPRTIM